MKKNDIQIIVIILIATALLIGCTDMQSNHDNISSISDTNMSDVGTVDTYEDCSILGITFGTTFQELVNTLGEPNNIIPIRDEMTIVDKGYFSLLEYDDYEILINDNENFEISPDCLIVEIDATNESYITSKGIHIGSTIEDVIREYGYSYEDIYDKSNEEIISNMRITGLRGTTKSFVEYDQYGFITNKEEPVALIFLFDNDKVVRIMIRHLTAD